MVDLAVANLKAAMMTGRSGTNTNCNITPETPFAPGTPMVPKMNQGYVNVQPAGKFRPILGQKVVTPGICLNETPSDLATAMQQVH